jgi:amino acid adenylation domain-containing protein
MTFPIMGLDSSANECAQPHSIVSLFEAQAERTPEAIAVQLGQDRLSYRELNERSNQLARALQRRGVKSSSLVATSFERSLEMIVAMLAVLKAGCAYVPLDSSYPLERLTMLVGDAQPSVVLTQEKLAGGLPESAASVICIDTEWPAIGREERGNLPTLAHPDSLAYVIYTSGSTGKPKGVLVTHHNVVRLLRSTDPWFGFGETDVWTLFHSSSFDFSVWEIWGCLLTGGRLVIVPYLVTRSPQDFYSLLAQEQVTVLNQTPAAFYQLIHVEEAGLTKPLALRHVIFGGEALNFASLRPWLKRHGDRAPQLVNMYGITETTVHVTYRPLTMADVEGESRSLIGIPIPDLRLYVLDARQRPVPEGVVGEIHVGGAGVAQGYLNRPELTAERFIADPFSDIAGARMYKSGDLARQLPTGDLEYLGRADTQVKIRGFRIELGEIDAALVEHPAVQQAATIVRKDATGDPRLLAYFVIKSGCAATSAEIREHLQAKLPAHMIPNACVPIDAIPLTINGKVDHAALPDPQIVTRAGPHSEASLSPIEQLIAGIWRRRLNIDQIGRDDNFFDVGGDSLMLVNVHRDLQTELAVEIPVTALFEFTTVRTLADHLTARTQTALMPSQAQERGKRQRNAFALQRNRNRELS